MYTLLEPFQRLCLTRLEELYRDCGELSAEYNTAVMSITAWWHFGTTRGAHSTHTVTTTTHRSRPLPFRRPTAVQHPRSSTTLALEWDTSSLQDEMHRSGSKLKRRTR